MTRWRDPLAVAGTPLGKQINGESEWRRQRKFGRTALCGPQELEIEAGWGGEGRGVEREGSWRGWTGPSLKVCEARVWWHTKRISKAVQIVPGFLWKLLPPYTHFHFLTSVSSLASWIWSWGCWRWWRRWRGWRWWCHWSDGDDDQNDGGCWCWWCRLRLRLNATWASVFLSLYRSLGGAEGCGRVGGAYQRWSAWCRLSACTHWQPCPLRDTVCVRWRWKWRGWGVVVKSCLKSFH